MSSPVTTETLLRKAAERWIDAHPTQVLAELGAESAGTAFGQLASAAYAKALLAKTAGAYRREQAPPQ